MKQSPACVNIYIYKYTKKLRGNCKIKLPVQHYLSCLNTCLTLMKQSPVYGRGDYVSAVFGSEDCVCGRGYGVAMISRLLKITGLICIVSFIGLFCKRDL